MSEPNPEPTDNEEHQEQPVVNAREMTRREFLTLALALGAGLFGANELWKWFVSLRNPLEAGGNGEGNESPYWIMVIDLGACIGCMRCVYACQATNNTSTGHLWNIVLHDDTTFERPVYVPRPCMHCVHAPCVEVCPVQATYHRPDGLVAMDYDRCIGCRYCMVACPYGVRVFNWSNHDGEANPQVPTWGQPEVERRPRGVAEKCTFCSQRLDAAAERNLRPGYDRAATPACCVICPTEARTFGDLNDPNSPAMRKMEGRQAVFLRSDLGTHPRVYYLLPT